MYFSVCCRKEKTKKQKERETYKISEDKEKPPKMNIPLFLFSVHGQKDIGVVNLTVVGVKLENVLIESGSINMQCN